MSTIEGRDVARDEIIAAANRQIFANPYYGTQRRLLSARHIQQAVCIVRRRQLVKPETLILAGFNAKG